MNAPSPMDVADFCEYVRQNQERFYRCAYSYTHNHHDALDIVQDAICKAILSIRSLRDAGSVQTWFYRIVIHTAIDCTRKKKRLTSLDERTESSIDPNNEDAMDLRKAMEQLDEKYRMVVYLKYFEDMTFEDIARTLDLSPNTVKTRLYAALDKLKLQMNPT